MDLIFLDINMPHLTGLDFVRSLTAPPMIIFTTACPEYAVESYEVAAIDFLPKLIRFQRFFQAVSKAEEKFISQKTTVTEAAIGISIKKLGRKLGLRYEKQKKPCKSLIYKVLQF